VSARKGPRKSQIIREAVRVFSEKGYDAATIRDIAEACGITEPAVYRHFESKEQVFDAVLESLQSRTDVETEFEDLEKEKDLGKILSSLASHIIRSASEDERIHRLLLHSALMGHEKAKRVYQVVRGGYVRFLQTQLDRLYEEGIIVKKNNLITARCFIGMVFDCALSTTLWKGMQGKVYGPSKVIANNIPIYVRGLTGRLCG